MINCIKNSQLPTFVQLRAFWIIFAMFASGCGKKINPNQEHLLPKGVIDQLVIEQNCQNRNFTFSPESLKVMTYSNEFFMKEPDLLNYVSDRSYDYNHPLVLKPEYFLQKLELIKKFNEENLNRELRQKSVVDELYHLDVAVRRYEFMKCKFPQMTQKFVEDPRAFLKLGEVCSKNGEQAFCDLENLKKLSSLELEDLSKKAVVLCQSLTNNLVACRSEAYVKKNQRKLPEFIHYYQEQYRRFKYSKFTLLSPNARQFKCEKADGKVTLKLTIFAPELNLDQFMLVTNALKNHWSDENFSLSIARASQSLQGSLKIKVSNGIISHVNSEFPDTIFLSLGQSAQQNSKIIAHEFGHVLGFPDCYTEIFDQKMNELIYFEHKKNEYNLMCTIKNFSRIPPSYFRQIIEKSCVF